MLLSDVPAPPLLTKPDLVKTAYAVSALPKSPCVTCHYRKRNFCGAMFDARGEDAAIKGKHLAVAARRNVYRAGEPNEGVLVICTGWAARFVQLPNGKRQILSVVMPGDLASPNSLFEPQFSFSIQALTDVRYCYFPFAEVRARIQDDPALFDHWLRLSAAEHRDADRRLVDLGQRPAQERIAAFIAGVMVRSEDRGELRDDEFPLPMSQQQIADFAGLTPVHTCRILSLLRKKRVCDVGHGVVKIADRIALERMASPGKFGA
jgi:CRP/FNR family transcriptional regulator, anaerobic regulatory protein